MKSEQPNRDVGIDAVQGAELSELQWTAFRYLTDELPPELASDFERQLADNPLAVEALDQMLRLLSGLEATASEAAESLTRQVTPVERNANSTAVRRNVQWIAALAAAVLVLLGISQFIASQRQNSQQGRFEVSLDGEKMAELWASSLSNELRDADEDLTEDEPESDEWLYSALVSLESLENWPAEEQGGS